MEHLVVDAQISPEGRLEVLSKIEVAKLLDTSQGGLYNIFRNCSLAVLNCGNALDDGKELLERYKNFDISIVQRERGIKLDIKNAPAKAFVDGKMIKGTCECSGPFITLIISCVLRYIEHFKPHSLTF